MKLSITTPQQSLVEADSVDAVYAVTKDGEVGILPNHIPMVAPLKVGIVRYVSGNREHCLTAMGGLIHTNGTNVTLVSEVAEHAEDIDEVRAQQARERAEQRLKQQDAELDIDRAKLALAKAITRLKAKQTDKK